MLGSEGSRPGVKLRVGNELDNYLWDIIDFQLGPVSPGIVYNSTHSKASKCCNTDDNQSEVARGLLLLGFVWGIVIGFGGYRISGQIFSSQI